MLFSFIYQTIKVTWYGETTLIITSNEKTTMISYKICILRL